MTNATVRRQDAELKSPGRSLESSSVPYVLPFGLFVGLLAFQSALHLSGIVDLILRTVLLVAALLIFSRGVITLKMTVPLQTVLLGVAVFVIWIAPDILFPNYRQSIFFQNAVLGRISSSFPDTLQRNPLGLGLRCFRAVVLVPIIEELFWRAWFMRWLIDHRFETVRLGAYAAGSFWITAILFASEHGPFWDVGLIAGILYNFWMIRTRSLGDCIIAHAITNACLCAYVIAGSHWQYWL